MYRVKAPNGLEIVCDSPDEVLALVNSFGKGTVKSPATDNGASRPAQPTQGGEAVIKFLETLRVAGSRAREPTSLCEP